MEPTADDRMKFVYLLGMHYIWMHDWAEAKGYRLSLGDAYRPPKFSWEGLAQFGAVVKKALGYFHDTSFHCKRCAQDINLFKQDCSLCESVEDYREPGEHWKSLDPMCAWGGDFKTGSIGDANHFSLGEGK